MDARDYVQMRLENRRREGLKDEPGHSQPIGSFEKFTKVREFSPVHSLPHHFPSYIHTSFFFFTYRIFLDQGFGRRVMEKQGWKDGEGLGNSQTGIPEALENEGQHPRCKRGFG